jgi:hypothetical protein
VGFFDTIAFARARARGGGGDSASVCALIWGGGQRNSQQISSAEQLKGNGVDTIACNSVSDPLVMGAWAKDLTAGGLVVRGWWYGSVGAGWVC